MNKHKPDKSQKWSIQEHLRYSMETARQLMQPAAFRIAAPEDSEWKTTEQNIGETQTASAENRFDALMKTIAAVATALWRAKSKLNAESEARLPDELRNLPRHIQAAWDALGSGQIQVDDPTGCRYVPGMAVNILTIQPLGGITFEIINETIKPSVHFKDMLIQRADVIVARPSGNTDQNAIDDEASHNLDSAGPDHPQPERINTDDTLND